MIAALLATAAMAPAAALPVATAHHRAVTAAAGTARIFKPRKPKITVDGCARRSRRTVDCTAIFEFDKGPTCTLVIRVTLRRHKLAVLFPRPPVC